MATPLIRARRFERFLLGQLRYEKEYSQLDLKRCRFTPNTIRPGPDQKVYCLGDLHGDIEVLWSSLNLAGLIDASGNWTGGDKILIQLGDLFDSVRPMTGHPGVPYAGGEERIVNFLKNLHLQAIEQGGMVVTCLGNHDINRLFAFYDDQGEFVGRSAGPYQHFRFVNGSEARHLGSNVNQNSSLGYWNAYDPYATQHDKAGFNGNRSISRLIDPDQYALSNDEGFHRQLLANCATKVLVKVVWGDAVGFLGAHGGFDYPYLMFFKRRLVIRFNEINKAYNTSLPTRFSNEGLITIINSIMSFILRSYHETPIDDSPIDNLVLDYMGLIIFPKHRREFESLAIVHQVRSELKLGPNDPIPFDQYPSPWPGILREGVRLEKLGQRWMDGLPLTMCRPVQPNTHCKISERSLLMFGLDPKKSSVVVAHSGPDVVNRTYPVHRRAVIPLDADNFCHGIYPENPNLILITDVTASKAFPRLPHVPRMGVTPIANPQVLVASYEPAQQRIQWSRLEDTGYNPASFRPPVKGMSDPVDLELERLAYGDESAPLTSDSDEDSSGSFPFE
jgi:hypothetical protein